MQSAGAGAIAGVTMTAASGIEIALWDLVRAHSANARLQSARRPVPRPRALLSHHAGPSSISKIPPSWRDQVHEARAEKWGWTAFKFQGEAFPCTPTPNSRSRATILTPRNLTHADIRRIVKGMETVREDAGPRSGFRHRMPLALRHRAT